MDYFTKLRAEIERDADARIETAQAILAEAEAHKANVLALLAETRAELVEDLSTVRQNVKDYIAMTSGQPEPTSKWDNKPFKFKPLG